MPKVTPSEYARKWANNLRGSVEYIRAGVQKVTTAPSEKAIAAKDRLKARWNQAIDSGIWESALRKYTLEQWKRDMTEKGIPRIPDGVDKAVGKMEEFGRQLLSYIDANLPNIEKMPKVTLEDSVRRATEWIRIMAKFRKGGTAT